LVRHYCLVPTILLDKQKNETFRIGLGTHRATPHGIAVAKGKIYVSTDKGQIVCFGS